MNGYAYQLLPALLLATLGLTAAALVTWCLLRYSRAVSPRVHRLAWCAVLLVGWSFARLPIEVPWYDPVPPAEVAVLLDEPPSALLIAPLNEEVIEAPATGIIELSGTYEELSPEPVASAAGAEPLIELTVTPELSAPILAEMPPVLLDPAAAVTKLPQPGLRPFWSDIDPWLTLAAVWVASIGAIVLAWLTGYLWFVLRLPVGRAADPSWLDEWRTLLDSRGVRRSIPLRVTLNLGPMLCRLPGGYTLVVPEPLWRELDESGRRAILRHELAHYERGDVWWSLLARVLALPNWFNPASWYCVRKFDEAAEWACDRAATADQPVTDYARALLRLGTDAHGYASYRPAAAGKPLAGRIRRLLRLREARDSKMKATLLIAAALIMATAALVRVELVAREAPPTQGTVELKDENPQPTAEPVIVPQESFELHIIPDDANSEQSANAEQTRVRTAAQATVNAAKQAYEANVAAYEDGRATLDAVYIWSLRWLNAAERAPPPRNAGDPSTLAVNEHQLNGTKEHLERMKKVRAGVKALFDVAARGGEQERLNDANFYVAEAERMVAELEASLPKLSGALQLNIVPQPKHTRTLTPTPATPDAQPTPALVGGLGKILVESKPAEQPVPATPAPVAKPRPAIELTAPALVPAVPQSGLTVQMTAPDAIAGGETAEFKIAVANKGQQRFSQVKVAVKWDVYLEPVAVTDGYTWKDREIVWLFDGFPSGKTIELQLNCRAAKNYLGRGQCLVTVSTREGPRSEAQADIEIHGRAEAAPTPAPAEEEPFGEPTAAPAGRRIGGGRPMGGRPMGGGGRPLEQATDPAAAARKFNLRYDGKRYDEWRNILTTELSDEGQFKAIDALGAFAAKGYGAEVATVLLGIRPEPRSGLSVKIVNALLKIPKEVAVPHLATAGQSDDEVTRRLALIALANAAPSSDETKAALKSALHDSSPIVVEAAINLMVGGSREKYYLAETRFPALPELAPDLAELLAKLDENRTEASGNLDRDYLVNALVRCGPAAKVALPTVIPWLGSEDWNTRVRAFSIIGAVGAEAGEAVPALIALLKESPGIDAQRRASSLGRAMVPEQRSLTAITLETLAKIGPPAKEAVPTILESAKSTRNLNDVAAAITALEAIGPLSKDAVPLLIRAFGGQHKISMMKKLGQIGPDAAEAVPLLKTYSENTEIDPGYVEAAREALKRIQPDAK